MHMFSETDSPCYSIDCQGRIRIGLRCIRRYRVVHSGIGIDVKQIHRLLIMKVIIVQTRLPQRELRGLIAARAIHA